MTGDNEKTFTAVRCDAVSEGTCVAIRGNEIIYAGPLKLSPKFGPMGEVVVMMNETDFNELNDFIKEKDKRHAH